METLVNKSDKIDIKEFLEGYPELKKQFLFFDCLIISSEHIKFLYQRAKEKKNGNFKNIEIYYTPNYLYIQQKNNQIFDKINKQKRKKFYYLKEHMFYYQYLLQLSNLKKEMEKKEETDTTYINEISYRTLLNKLYLLCDQPNLKSNNYGISEIFSVPCIYSIMELNIIDQIMNMKKFSYELMQMNKDKVIQLFGINRDIDLQSYIYNKLLIAISEGNSTIKEEQSISEGINDDLNKINKNVIEMENFLINISSELFLFHYITNQFDNDKLIQIPRMIFFCCLYNYNCDNIYEIKEKNSERKKEEEKKNFIQENKTKTKTEGKKEIKGKKVNKKKEETKILQKKVKEKISEKTKKKGPKEKQDKNGGKKDKIEKKEKPEKFQKHLLKCKMMNFVGTLELDGAFKYIGEEKEIETNSLVILMSEYISKFNNIFRKSAEKYEAKSIIKKLDKYKNNLDYLKAYFKKNKIFKIDVEKEPIQSIKKKYEEIANRNIIFSKEKVFKKNDIILLENKREFPNHISDEVCNFIDHSLYFISLYQNLKLLEKTSEIHLLFVYDHSRNYNDEGLAAMGLYNFIIENSEKLSLFENKIKFYLIHSLPNLSISIFDKLGKNITDSNEKNNILAGIIENQNSKICDLTKENEILKINLANVRSQNKKLMADMKNLENENRNLKIEVKTLKDENRTLNNDVKMLKKENGILKTEVKRLKNENEKYINQSQQLIEIVNGLNAKVEILEKEILELKSKKNNDTRKNQENDKK